MSDIDSDDDFVVCYECEIEVSVDEVCFYNKDKFCKKCYEECIQHDVAQPVRMIYKRYEDIGFSCCSRRKCVHIKSGCATEGHVHLSSCDPEIENYPLGLGGIFSKTNMHNVYDGIWLSQSFEETNLLRRLRLQKMERLENEKIKVEKEKAEKEKEKAEKKLIARQQQKGRWEGLTIGTKIAELEVEICRNLHPNSIYAGGGDGGLGLRLMLYENDRFKELQKICPVIEQASRALYNFIQPPHLQIENPYEKKDQIEKILEILEKWLEEIDPTKYREIKGFPRPTPPPPFCWDNHKKILNMTSK